MATTDLERLVVQLSADIKKYENAMARATGLTQRRANEIERRFLAMNAKVEKSFAGMGNRISSSLDGALRSTVALAATAIGVREITQYADAWTEAGNKINAAATSAGVQARSLDALKDGANEARTAFGDYVDLYARLIRSASGVAKSEQEIANATSIVSKAFKAGGASAQEQAAGILQLGQALGSGVLQGDELRSLRENAPILAQAIANEFKTTIAGLKQLGAEGKLTSERVFKAILNAQKPIEAQFKATNSTIRDAVTSINNEFTSYIGNADASAGASAKLVEALNYLADNFKEVGDVVLEFVTIIVGALTGRALVGLVVGLGNAVAALGAFITAVRTGTLVAGGFAAALGPLGVVAGAAAAAIYLMNGRINATESAINTANTAIGTNAAAIDQARKSSEGYTAALRNQIAMQLEVAKAEMAAADAAADAAVERAASFRKTALAFGIDAKFEPFEYAANVADRNAQRISVTVGKLQDQLAEVDKNLKSTGDGFGGGIGDVGGSGGKTRANEYAREVEQIQKRTAALQAETAAQAGLNPLLNDYGYTLEFARAKQDLLTAAQEAGVKITPELTASIEDLAAGYANAVVASEQLAEKQDEIRQRAEDAMATAKDVTRGIIDGFVEGASAADILADSLKKIGDALLDDVLNSIFKVNNAAGGSGGGFLSSIFGGLFGGGGKGSFPSAPMPMYAAGTSSAKSGVALVGEKGPELVRFSGGEQVIPNHRLASALSAPSLPDLKSVGGGVGSRVAVTFSPVIDARGASAEAVARLEKIVAKQSAELPYRVEAAVRSANKRNVKLS
ncbi:tape measure protein [Agrobacterium tumefaciens]|uniref:tape measure protein n=1 Tax=Agrobacterium tumefaciens TaxID=358 RepID=UPI003B9F5880